MLVCACAVFADTINPRTVKFWPDNPSLEEGSEIQGAQLESWRVLIYSSRHLEHGLFRHVRQIASKFLSRCTGGATSPTRKPDRPASII